MTRKMPKQQPGSSRQDYVTPNDFISAVCGLLEIDRFAVDLAATKTNRKAPDHIAWGAEDALSYHSWAQRLHGGWGWLNPPFGRLAPWARTCQATARDGGRVAFLTPASVGAVWFDRYVFGTARVYFFRPRLCFKGDPYPKDLMLSIFSPEALADPFVATWQWSTDFTPKCNVYPANAARHHV